MADIFISHVEEDAQIALEIVRGLEAAGYTVWYYERDSVPGLSYLVQTGQAIEQSRAVLLIITVHSLGSNQVSSEVVRAHEVGKPFIPVLSQVSHSQFQTRQPLWRQAIGSASSIAIPPEGVAAIIPRIVGGLSALGIEGKGKGEGREPRLAEAKPCVLSRVGERHPGTTASPHAESRPVWQNKWLWIVTMVLVAQGIIIAFLVLKLTRLPGISTSLRPLVTPSMALSAGVPSPTLVPEHSPAVASAPITTYTAPRTVAPVRVVTPVQPSKTVTIVVPTDTTTPVGTSAPEPIKAYNLPLNNPSEVIYDGSGLCVQFPLALVRLELVEEESRFRISEQECHWPPGSLAWNGSRGQFWFLEEEGIALKDQTGTTTTPFEMPKAFLGTPTNIAWDGQYLWVISSEGAIYKLVPVGDQLNVVDSYATDFGIFPSSRASGLVWDGAYLWVLVDNRVTKVDDAIQRICAVLLPSGPVWWGWKGMAWDGQFLWVIHGETNKLYRVDPRICD